MAPSLWEGRKDRETQEYRKCSREKRKMYVEGESHGVRPGEYRRSK